MKVFVLLLILTITQVFASGVYSQTARISLNLSGTTVANVLDEIQAKSDFDFVYNNKLIDVERKVDINVEDKDIYTILGELFDKTDVEYVVKDKHIILSNQLSEEKEQSIQSNKIKGKVTSYTGEPVPGVTVLVKGTNIGTNTDLNGNYSITATDKNTVLVFSFIGMRTQEIIGNKEIVDVVMEEETIGLEEVVAIGYGIQKKEEVTTSMAKVKTEDFIQGMVKSPAQFLEGKVAGLAVSNTSGNPTDPIQFMIRGTNTLASSQEPLVVIDGIAGGSLYAIAPEDIEDMTVLKDGSAAAIYGTRGTNGVILITTKKSSGKKGMSVEYNASLSMDEISNSRDMLTADDYLRYSKDNETKVGAKTLSVIFAPLTDTLTKTDWVKAITRKPINQTHNLSFKGGDDKSNFIASLTYREQNGTLLNSDRTSYSVRLGANHSAFNNRLRFSVNFNNSTYKDHNVWTYAYETALLMNPTQAINNEDGTYFQYGTTQRPYNPVSLLKEETDLNNWNQLLTNAKITIEPIKGWNINAMGAIQRNDGMRDKWSTFQHPNTTVLGNSGNVWKWANQNFDYTAEITTDFTKTIGNHNFSIMGGYSYNYFTVSNSYMYSYQFASDQFQAWSFAPSSAIKNGLSDMQADRWDSKLVAFFGRATYNYDQKYLVMATLRREGSSKFGLNNKWGYFPAISLGWRINKESFMENVSFVDDLKLRVGYGVTGTIPTDSYRSLLLLKFDNTKVAYFNGEWVKGVIPSQNPNPDLKWETKQEYNIGLDFGLFKNRLTGNVDVYKRITSDLLNWYTVPQPPNAATTTFANAGGMENKGIEVVLNSTLVKNKDLKIIVSGNFSFNENTVTSIANDLYSSEAIYAGSTGSPIQQVTHKIVPGESIGNFWGWKAVGLDQKKGSWLYLGQKGDTIAASKGSDGDKVVIGNGIPKMYAGLNATVIYKGFDLYINFRGAFKFQVWNQFRSHYENFSVIGSYNIPRSTFDRPYAGTAYNTQASAYNSYFIENGDFVKLDNISLGYTIKVPQSWSISKLRVYVSGLNLHTFTKYSGLDPEVSMLGLYPGIEPYDAYPKTTTFTMGLNVTF